MKKSVIVRRDANEIIVYQPDGVKRIDVHFDGETVWLLQSQIADLFGCLAGNIRLHLKNIYASGELEMTATSKESVEVSKEGGRKVARRFSYFNLDAIISTGYRVNSIVGVRFRQWATQVIKDRMFVGAVMSAQMAAMDRRLMAHDRDIVDLKEKVDFLIKTDTPPTQGVFYDGRLWDARSFVEKLIASARKSVLLIDNWATAETLGMLAKKRKGVAVMIVTSEYINRRPSRPDHKIAASDVEKFNAQYPALEVKYGENFHDRFLILDDKDVCLIGASLKDLGRKCFGFTKMDAAASRKCREQE